MCMWCIKNNNTCSPATNELNKATPSQALVISIRGTKSLVKPPPQQENKKIIHRERLCAPQISSAEELYALLLQLLKFSATIHTAFCIYTQNPTNGEVVDREKKVS